MVPMLASAPLGTSSTPSSVGDNDRGYTIAAQCTHPWSRANKTKTEKFPWISYSDLWILSGVVAVQEMLGPNIPYRPGRTDKDVAACTPDGRLPDAAQAQDHLRKIFYRMGFNDQEIVALTGAHALGRCHANRSGYDGPWTFSPTVLTNDFYNLLLNEKWQWKKWDGPKQVSLPPRSHQG